MVITDVGAQDIGFVCQGSLASAADTAAIVLAGSLVGGASSSDTNIGISGGSLGLTCQWSIGNSLSVVTNKAATLEHIRA